MILRLLIFLFCLGFIPASAVTTLSAELARQVAAVSPDNRERAQQLAEQLNARSKDPIASPRLYLDLDSTVSQDVFNKPGFFSEDDCSREGRSSKRKLANPCKTVGSAKADATLYSTGRIQFAESRSEDDEKSLATFYEVYYIKDSKPIKGWVSGDTVSMTPTLSDIRGWFDKICDTFPRPSIFSSSPKSGNNLDHFSDIHTAYQKDLEDQDRKKESIDKTAAKISNLVGQCVLDPPNKAPTNVKGDIVYDEKVLPAVMTQFTAAHDLNIPGLNAQKLVEIDAMARTIFAEMASCIPIGSQYSMAVARVIRNRELAMVKNPNASKEFIYQKDQHWPGKNDVTRAASSPVQFSAWNKDVIDFDALAAAREDKVKQLRRGGMSSAKATKQAAEDIKPDAATKAYYKFNESGLLHTLCPPSHPKKPYYDGHPPSKSLHEIWKNTVKVAVEAVLYPESFNKKTDSMKEVFHYTSGRKKFYNYEQVRPSIQGRPINSDRCLNLWVKPKDDSKSKIK